MNFINKVEDFAGSWGLISWLDFIARKLTPLIVKVYRYSPLLTSRNVGFLGI